MYGTVAHMKAKPGQFDAIMEMTTSYSAEHNPKGYVGEYVYRLDDDSDAFMLVVMFDSKENYQANAGDPEQDKWFQKLRGMLAQDPYWHDGEVIHHRMK